MEHKTLQPFAADASSVELWLILAPSDMSRNSNSKGTDVPMTWALQGKHLAASLGGFKEPLRCTLMFSPSPNPGAAATSCFCEPQMNCLTGPWHQRVHHRVWSARASSVSTVGLGSAELYKAGSEQLSVTGELYWSICTSNTSNSVSKYRVNSVTQNSDLFSHIIVCGMMMGGAVATLLYLRSVYLLSQCASSHDPNPWHNISNAPRRRGRSRNPHVCWTQDLDGIFFHLTWLFLSVVGTFCTFFPLFDQH